MAAIAARYDKIHMFDVNVSATEVYRESEGYRPGDRAVLAETPFAQDRDDASATTCGFRRCIAAWRRRARRS